MDLELLTTAHAVARWGSLRAASDDLLLTQPAISKRIQRLESEVGLALFRRTGRGMVPTAEGQRLLDRTRGMVQQIERALADLRDPAPLGGEVAVGLIPTLGSDVIGDLVQRCALALPRVRMRLAEDYSAGLISRLHRGDLDVAVVYGSDPNLALDAYVIGSEALAAVTAPGVLDGAVVDTSDVIAMPLALPSTAH